MPAQILIDAIDGATGAAVTLRASSHDDVDACNADNAVWWPAIAKLPTLRYDFFDGAFGAAITAPSANTTLRTEPWANFPDYRLAGARIRIRVRDDAGAWPVRFDGRITAEPKVADGAAEIAFAVDDSWLDTPLLALYAGTTGIEGPAEIKGQAKPLALGAPRYVPGKLIDSVNTVFQVSAYGAIEGVEMALERLARLGDATGDYSTLTALIAADIPNGGWATCNAFGLVRFGAPVEGQVSFLVRGDKAGAGGWARKPGAIIRRLAEIAGGGARVDLASLAAMDAARPYNLSLYLDQQTTARQLIQSIAASVNAVAVMTWLGTLVVLPVAIGQANVELQADGSALPPVRSTSRIDLAAPFKKLAITAARTWAVHALADVAFTATLIERGTYDATEQYREGHIVSLPDGSRWIFVGAVPLTGLRPSPGHPSWSILQSATVAVGSDGAPLEDKVADAVDAVAGVVDAIDQVTNLTILAPKDKLALYRRVQESDRWWYSLQATFIRLAPPALPGEDATVAFAAADASRRARLAVLASIAPAWDDLTQSSTADQAALTAALDGVDLALNRLDTALKTRLPSGAVVQQAVEPTRKDLLWMPDDTVVRANLPKTAEPAMFESAEVTFGGQPVIVSPGTAWVDTADRTSAVAARVDGPATIQIAADADGVTTTPLPKSVQLFAFEGATDVTEDAVFALDTPPAGIVAEVTGATRGRLTITKADAAGDINVRVTLPRGGAVLKTVKVQRSRAASGGTGGAGSASASTSAWTDPAATTHAQITPTLTVKSSAAGKLVIRASASFQANTAQVSTTYLKAAYRAVGTTAWSDVSAEVVGAAAVPGTGSALPPYKQQQQEEYLEPSYDTPGYVDLPETEASGLTASTDYEIAGFARLAAGDRPISWLGDQLLAVRS